MPNRSPLSKIHFKKPLSNEADVGGYPPSFSSPLVPTSAVKDVVESNFWWLPDSAAAVGETFALVAIICSLLVSNIRPNLLYIFVPVALSLVAGCVMRVMVLMDIHPNLKQSAHCFTASCDSNTLDACLGICRIVSEIIVLLAKLVLFFRYTFAYQTILNSIDAKSFLTRFGQDEIPTTSLLPNVDFFPIDCAILSVCIAFELLEGYRLIRQGIKFYRPISGMTTFITWIDSLIGGRLISKGINRIFLKQRRDAYRSLLDSVLGYSFLLMLTVLTHSRDVSFFSSFFKYLPWFYFTVTIVRFGIAVHHPFFLFFNIMHNGKFVKNEGPVCLRIKDLLYVVRVEIPMLLSAIVVAAYQYVNLKTSLLILFVTLVIERIVGGYYNIEDNCQEHDRANQLNAENTDSQPLQDKENAPWKNEEDDGGDTEV